MAPGGVEPPPADSKLGDAISAGLGWSGFSLPGSGETAESEGFDLG